MVNESEVAFKNIAPVVVLNETAILIAELWWVTWCTTLTPSEHWSKISPDWLQVSINSPQCKLTRFMCVRECKNLVKCHTWSITSVCFCY